MKTFRSFAVLLAAALAASCGFRTPIYRANLKLLVTTAGPGMPASELTRDDDSRFLATQTDILMSQTMLRRAQMRMKKTPDEIRAELTDLQVAPIRNSDIIVVTVDSPSPDFARDFANALAEEYLRFRDEQRAQTAESALLQLTRECNRLGQELKVANANITAYVQEHKLSPDAETPELQNLRDDRERVRSLYNALLGQLMKIDATQSFNARNVSILEPAIVEPKPVNSWSRREPVVAP